MSQFQHDPENKAYIGYIADDTEDSLSEPALELVDSLDSREFLPIRGARPDTLTTRKRQAYRVGKCGMKSGLTFGVVGEIEAVLRMPLGDGQDEQISWALLIISHPRKEYPGHKFSRKGDSGSCIFDFSGRVVGILDAGQRSRKVRRFENFEQSRTQRYHPGTLQRLLCPRSHGL